MLPVATTSRFQPLRSGLINLFKYENQEFWYERGRLLIRGNNGTGKSRVLALQLPFLLDGEIGSHRVEPDGDPARHLVWHLLMDEHEQRTGYTWIEFGRLDDAGAEHYLTLGCGMRGVRGGDNQPTRWFFITTQRVGKDFELLNGTYPHSKERLVEVLGSECLFAAARDYREEIDRRLFELGKNRYTALIDLLIRLRSPQLSKKLEEKTIFAALSSALPPLSEDVVRHVADAFKQLDEIREQYAALQSLHGSLAVFQAEYQSYLQMVLQLCAERVRVHHGGYEAAQRKVNSIVESIDSQTAAKAEADAQAKEANARFEAADAQFAALSTSSASGDAKRLDDAKLMAEEKLKQAFEAESRAQLALTQLEIESLAEETQNAEHDQRLKERDASWDDSTKLASTAGVALDHARLLAEAIDWPTEHGQLAKLKAKYGRLVADHEHRLRQIDDGLAAVKAAQIAHTAAQADEDALAKTADAHREDVHAHAEAAQAALGSLATAYAAWHATLRWLTAPMWSDLAQAFGDWLETAEDSHRVLDATLNKARESEAAAVATCRAEWKARIDQLRHERLALISECESLALAVPPPPPPRTRDQESRSHRPGAPLWQACEFHPALSEPQRAGLEAALEASGLLDAWITPDGSIAGDFPGDTFLGLGDEPPLHTETLAQWLVPDLDDSTGITPDVLQGVLATIGAGEGCSRHWVALDGRWQLGPVLGRGIKMQAQHLGATSREMAREKRLAEIQIALRLLDEREATLAHQAAQLDAREKEGAAESQCSPRDQEIATHLALRTNARIKLVEAARLHANAMVKTQRAREKTAQAADKLRHDATHLGYREHLDRLETLRPAWAPYDRAMVKFFGDMQAWITSATHLHSAANRARMAAENQAQTAYAADTARTAALRADETFRTLQSSLGSSVSEYQAKLEFARRAKAEAQMALTAASHAVSASEKRLVELQASLQPAQDKVSDAGAERDKAIQALRVPLLFDLFPEAHPSLADIETDAWSPNRAIIIARRIGKELPEADATPEAWTSRLNALNTQINDLRNRTGAACEIESQMLSEGLTMVECRYQGSRLKPAACLTALEIERSTHERLLGEKERDIIDRHLVTEVSLQLQALIESGQKQTTLMNEEMTQCATTLGVSLRLVWEPVTEGLPAGLPAVRKLLLVDHAAWTSDERKAVGDCLHQLIQNERMNNPQKTSAEQLLQALDYRQWHAFYAERRHKDKWERLNKKRYGTLSAGEKALTLTIPQMAAAASHYRSAAKHAPRFILLDEAFAGMDKPTRGSCMGLLEAFDLDLVMTSEREWGAHATISGIAIYQLVANAEAIAATRWVWNGKTKLIAPVPDTPELRNSTAP